MVFVETFGIEINHFGKNSTIFFNWKPKRVEIVEWFE